MAAWSSSAIGFADTKRRKYAGLVPATWVLRVQAVGTQLVDINNGSVAIGQLHGFTIVAT